MPYRLIEWFLVCWSVTARPLTLVRKVPAPLSVTSIDRHLRFRLQREFHLAAGAADVVLEHDDVGKPQRAARRPRQPHFRAAVAECIDLHLGRVAFGKKLFDQSSSGTSGIIQYDFQV